MTDHPKSPRDANQLAKFIVDVATGEESPAVLTESPKGVGVKGGKARAKSLNPEQRSTISSIAATARWKKSN